MKAQLHRTGWSVGNVIVARNEPRKSAENSDTSVHLLLTRKHIL